MFQLAVKVYFHMEYEFKNQMRNTFIQYSSLIHL